MSTPRLTLHVLPPSHPCRTIEAALAFKGLDYERVVLDMSKHGEQVQEIYGEGATTVPGMLFDDEPVHGSTAITERLEQLVADPPLYPEGIAEQVREAELWGDRELQDVGRRLPWGAMAWRPEYFGTYGGGGVLDPAGTDFAMRYVRASWKYHGLSCELIAEELEALPAKLERVAELAERGIVGGEAPTAADLQIGATLRILHTVGDLRPLLEAGPAAEIALRFFPDYDGEIPAGALPAGWVPSPD